MEREWKTIRGFDFKEILFEEYNHIAKITINRPRYRNAFTPLTVWEMSQAFTYCRDHLDIRVVILTGAGDKALLLRWRHARERTWRICGHRWCAAP